MLEVYKSDKDSSKAKRGTPRKELMPYAKGEYLQRAGEKRRTLYEFNATCPKPRKYFVAYRNIKNNKGSNTARTDKLTIKDIGRLTPEEVVTKVRYMVSGTKRGY